MRRHEHWSIVKMVVQWAGYSIRFAPVLNLAEYTPQHREREREIDHCGNIRLRGVTAAYLSVLACNTTSNNGDFSQCHAPLNHQSCRCTWILHFCPNQGMKAARHPRNQGRMWKLSNTACATIFWMHHIIVWKWT